MKWIKYIWILIMIYLVCTARTCNEDEGAAASREEQYIMALKDSVKHVFMSDSLSDQLLRAFEISATEKLNDFADYMKIISDTTLDLRFRQKATELIRNLFIDSNIDSRGWSRVYNVIGFNTLEQLLERSLLEGNSFWTQISQIAVNNPYTCENDSAFIGNLSFNCRLIPYGINDTLETGTEKLMIDIYLLKKLKSYGDEQFRAWEVYLGEIK
jgi:hypothetical protein